MPVGHNILWQRICICILHLQCQSCSDLLIHASIWCFSYQSDKLNGCVWMSLEKSWQIPFFSNSKCPHSLLKGITFRKLSLSLYYHSRVDNETLNIVSNFFFFPLTKNTKRKYLILKPTMPQRNYHLLAKLSFHTMICDESVDSFSCLQRLYICNIASG